MSPAVLYKKGKKAGSVLVETVRLRWQSMSIGAFLGCSITMCGIMAVEKLSAPKLIKEEGLTEGESKMAKSLFGEDFNTASIRKRYYDKNVCVTERAIACVARGGDEIHFVDSAYFADDYSLSANGWDLNHQHVLTHELTHIWQGRTGTTSEPCLKYGLPESLAALRHQPFDVYCEEEQAEIIGYYAAVFLRPQGVWAASGLPSVVITKSACYQVTQQHHDLLRVTVENRFPHVVAARLENEKKTAALFDCLGQFKGVTECLSAHYTNMAGKPLVVGSEPLPFTLPKKSGVQPTS